jgi:hypothetical protein
VTNDDIRRIVSEIKRELRGDVRTVLEGLARVERKVDGVSVRVGHLENDKVVRDVREDERIRAAKDAAEIVAQKAAQAISDREKSRKWWLGIAGAVTGGIVAVTTLTGVLAQYLSH